MKIHTYEVGPGHPCFIVAEGGSNHGGSLDAALALTDAAADAGAQAIKWQLWLSADELYDRSQFPTEWETTQRYTLPVEWLPTLRDRTHERGMAFGLSSFGFGSLDEADKWVDFHKVASIEASWEPFVNVVMYKRKPFILSTGMMDRFQWEYWRGFVYARGGITLQCAVAYPSDIADADLRAPSAQYGSLTPPPWGYSDHTLHPTIAPCAAVALGACVIEKHLRIGEHVGCRRTIWTTGQNRTVEEKHAVTCPDSGVQTPDWSHSLTPQRFREMVTAIRLTEQALGSSEKRVRESEQPYLKYRRGPRGLRGA